ncbi:hypothetical protein ACFQ88_19240 [Paenibacillus sp. NPDC056579]|uniref:hypothetical protein n=1 Tax=Paenibacillus sp. NPDC056579 TaxID=3345871 RepID=UPI0036755DC6
MLAKNDWRLVVGKAFMVVSEEIKQLANQSRRAIENVSQMTESVQEEIDAAVQTAADVYPLFQMQFESVKESSRIFGTV